MASRNEMDDLDVVWGSLDNLSRAIAHLSTRVANLTLMVAPLVEQHHPDSNSTLTSLPRSSTDLPTGRRARTGHATRPWTTAAARPKRFQWGSLA